jgi:hypothetical protein
MSEWWTYTLSDFLRFSERVYVRLFELHNRGLWPAQVATLALGLAVAGLLWARPRQRERIVLAILGGLWIWIAYAFFWRRYASINWAAPYVAPAFALQGLALIAFATAGRARFASGRGVMQASCVLLLVACLAVYPLLAPLAGRPWAAAELFGIAPDPTAVATLAVLAPAAGRGRWALFVVPCLWCAVTGATLWTLGAADFFVAPLGAGVAVGLAVARGARAASVTMST